MLHAGLDLSRKKVDVCLLSAQPIPGALISSGMEQARRAARRQGRPIDIARRLAHAIWHMLSRNQQFAPRGAAFRLAA
jgi:hypothetical protein